MSNFLTRLIRNFAPEVFRPLASLNPGILYLILQAVSREISGECPWATESECLQGFAPLESDETGNFLKPAYWEGPQCRNHDCPVYRSPRGVVAYTSRSDDSTSIDNRFDYSTFRKKPTPESATWYDEFVDVGTIGAQVRWTSGDEGQEGGWGAWTFGDFWFGVNAWSGATGELQIGDKFYLDCYSGEVFIGEETQYNMGEYRFEDKTIVHSGIPIVRSWIDQANKGGFIPVLDDPIGEQIRWVDYRYRGKSDTTYTLEIIDHWGYNQNFQNALLQICLATASENWLDYWGDYFGIPRIIKSDLDETDNDYRVRIIREITRARGTKPVLLEEAKSYFNNSDLVEIIEYMDVPIIRGTIPTGTASMVGNVYVPGIGYCGELKDKDVNWVTRGIKPGFVIFNETDLPDDETIRYSGIAQIVTTTTITFFPAMPDSAWFQVGDTYRITGKWDGIISPTEYPNEDARGLQPYQFYINTPTQKAPSAKFVKDGVTTTAGNAEGRKGFKELYADNTLWYQNGDTDAFSEITFSSNIANMFSPGSQADDAFLIGCARKFTGLKLNFVPQGSTTTFLTNFGVDEESIYAAESCEYNGNFYVALRNETVGLKIWEYDGANWAQVNTDGFGDVKNTNCQCMYVYDDKLWVGTINGTTGSEIWNYDGANWTRANTDGFGSAYLTYIEGMVEHGGKLYAAASCWGSGRYIASIWEYSSGTTWIKVSLDGMGRGHYGWGGLASFNGLLCAPGFNGPDAAGGELFVTDCTGTAPYLWTRVGGQGFYHSEFTRFVCCKVFNNALYIGAYGLVAGGTCWKWDGYTITQIGTDGWGEGSSNMSLEEFVIYHGRLYGRMLNWNMPMLYALENDVPVDVTPASFSDFWMAEGIGVYDDNIIVTGSGWNSGEYNGAWEISDKDGVYVWEYYSSDGWRTLLESDTFYNFMQDGTINWKLGMKDADYKLWQASVNVEDTIPDTGDGVARYWVRCRITTPPTQIPQIYDTVYYIFAGSTLRGNYCATGFIDQVLEGGLSYTCYQDHISPLDESNRPGVGAFWKNYWYLGGTATAPWSSNTYYNSCYHRGLSNYTPITVYTYSQRDKIKGDVAPYEYKNNIYIYEEAEFAKPAYESGLQDIIDRLKTAGTVAIVNPIG